MRIANLIPALALFTAFLGGCANSTFYSVDMLNGTDQTLQMEVRQGKGDTGDAALASKKVARSERFVWSGRAKESTYFRAVRLENDMPAGGPVELLLVPGSTTTATVQVADGQLRITNAKVMRGADERPEDIVPPPNRLPSNPNRR
jgi:hypothetical protein